MSFKKGDKVRCVNAYSSIHLKKGAVYTVDVPHGREKPFNPRFLQLVELQSVAPHHTYYQDKFELVADAPVQPDGRKDDSGKLAMNLLDDMPNALAAVVEVMQWAVTDKKPVPYERGSWQGVHADRYREAIKRHDRAACEQEVAEPEKQGARFQRDDETNLLHLAHIATSALMALENTIRELKGKQ